MEKRVLSWGFEGRSWARDGTVGPSLAEVCVVVTTGTEREFANLRSFWVVRTLVVGCWLVGLVFTQEEEEHTCYRIRK